MIKKFTITRISSKEIETQRGRTVKYGIQVKEMGEKWLGSFANKFNEVWLKSLAEGQIVDLVVTQNGEFWNFAKPGRIDYLEVRVAALESASKGSSSPAEETHDPLNGHDEEGW